MNLYPSVFRRKSIRRYDMQPLPTETLNRIESAMDGFESLYPDVPIRHRITQKVSGRFQVSAPHYLILGGEGKPGEAESIGFLFEQLALWFDAMELGCVWLGASRDAQGDADGDILAMAFGSPAEPLHRTADKFKRKAIETITNAPEDACIRAAHLAPSGMNTQPWYFDKQAERVLVYQQKLKLPLSMLYKHTAVDMGIALCHYSLAAKEAGTPFRFTRDENIKQRAGYKPFGIIA